MKNRISFLSIIILTIGPVFLSCMKMKIEENNEEELESLFSLILSNNDINNEIVLNSNMNLTKTLIVSRNLSIMYSYNLSLNEIKLFF